MLTIRTYLDKSPIDGMGVFAEEDIPKGTIVWQLNEKFDVIIKNSDDVAHLTTHQREFIKKYAFFDKQLKQWTLSCDNDRFTNHSDTPNIEPLENGEMIAIRDIKKGEEITCNYFDIDEDASWKNVKKIKNV